MPEGWKLIMVPLERTNIWFVNTGERDEEDKHIIEVRMGVGVVQNAVLMGYICGWYDVTWEGSITNWHGIWTEEPRTGGSRHLSTIMDSIIDILVAGYTCEEE